MASTQNPSDLVGRHLCSGSLPKNAIDAGNKLTQSLFLQRVGNVQDYHVVMLNVKDESK